MAYDLPTVVGTKIERPTVLKMAQEGLIVGMKDSSGDQDGFRSLLVEMRQVPGFLTFTGSEFLVDAVLIMGATGAVPGLCNVDPAAYVRLYNAVRAGDLVAAQAEQERLIRLFQIIYAGTLHPGRMGFSASAIGGFKTAVMLRGIFESNPVTAPLTVYQADEVERVRAVLQELDLL
jgi:4-hydroxy-tetrahydrodipicolinate synthase